MADAPSSSDRRGFLRRLGAVFAAVFGLPGAGAALSPALDGEAGDWKDVGAEADVPERGATRVTYTVRSGFEDRRKSAFLVREGGAIVALDSRCTHLGCTVRARDDRLVCPCHGGVFALDGAPLDGPATEPLRRLEVRVEDGAVQVKA